MTATTLLLDDHLVLRVLLGGEPIDLRPRGAVLVTTGLWYHRLCRAVANTTVTGSMSRQLGDVDETFARSGVKAVIELPVQIGLVSLRSLAWPMARLLHSGERLNLLSLEALASATELAAEICLAAADDNSPLRESAARHGINVRTIA